MTPFSFANSTAPIPCAIVHLLPGPEELSSPHDLRIRPNSETELRTGSGLLKMLRFALSAALIKIFFRTLEHLIALSMNTNLLVQGDCRLLC